jgi:hypothetical protein
MKQRLKEIEEQKRMEDQKVVQQELTVIMSSLQKISSGIRSELDQLDWLDKRNVIRKLVKRIEINVDSISIVFRTK